MIPTFILQMWLSGLFSVGLIGGAVYAGREWSMRSWKWDPVTQHSIFAPDFGANLPTLLFSTAIVLVVVVLAGRFILQLGTRAAGAGDPVQALQPTRADREFQLSRTEGRSIHIRFYGPEDGIPIICTHGWGLNSDEWKYLLPRLSEGFRIITWDLPGLGRSTRPDNRDFSLEAMAMDLDAVLSLAGRRPAILLGHSIGGMITLTFARLFPASLGTTVSGLILAHTTPTNPVRTTSGAAFLTAIERPVLVPLMYLTIASSPLVWLMNWLSYWNGSAQLSNKRSSFGGTETWEKVEFATRFQPLASPAVLARGMLAMMKYDARSVLDEIPVPTLVITGDLDTTTLPEAGEEIELTVQVGQLCTLTPAKHLGLIEHDADFAEAVREHSLNILASRSLRGSDAEARPVDSQVPLFELPPEKVGWEA